MFIECTKNNGTDYLRVTEGYRITENGVSKSKRRVVRNIGPLSRFDDGLPDYLSRLRKSFRDGQPIIESLADIALPSKQPDYLTVRFDRGNPDACASDPKNAGYFLLDSLYDRLGIYDVLSLHKSRSRIGYDLNGLAKLLVFGRVLGPDSKIATFGGRDGYVFPVTSSDSSVEVYRALDVLARQADAIQHRMNHRIKGSTGRNLGVCFYDVTNYWFEIHENDADTVDASGNAVSKGMRRKGVSKEKRGEPIIQMGLFIDDNGIPVGYSLFPGSHTDQTTLRPALEKTVDSMKFGRVVVIADGGLNSGPNIAHILDRGNGYIVAKSTRKSDKDVKKWMLEEGGYEWNGDRTFKVKSQIRRRRVRKPDGSMLEITEKLVCYWSKKHYERERHENVKFMEYLDAVIDNPDKLKDRQAKISKFLKKTDIDKKTGEVVDTHTGLSVDMEKVQQYLDLMGYYTLMTSETEMPDHEVIHKYHGLSRIEDSFRIIKSDLEGRPVYVRTPEHINAHFLICFIALTMVRLIQHRVLKYQGKDTLNGNGWESGVTAERIQKALLGFTADALPGGYYRLTKPNADLQLILDSLGLDGDLRLPAVSELKQLKYAFDRAPVM
jgi:transposase